MDINDIPKHMAVLSVTLNKTTNEVQVNGPIGDKILSYGMLSMAQEAIYDYHVALKQKQTSEVIKQASEIVEI